MPFFSASFYYAVSAPLSAGLTAADIDLVLYNIQDRDHKNRVLYRIVAERACEGLVLLSMGVRPERLAELERIGIPLVCVDYPQDGAPARRYGRGLTDKDREALERSERASKPPGREPPSATSHPSLGY